MRRWNSAQIDAALEAAVGNVDPQDPKGQKRMHILQAATGLFLQNGYRKTSVDEVAREAGVAKGTVYLYFETKAQLMVSAVALEKREFMSRVRHVFEEDMDPRERLQEYLVTMLVVANEMPLVSRLLQGPDYAELLADLPPELLASNEEMGLDFVSEMVEEVVGPDRWNRIEVEDRAKVLLGLSAFAAQVGNEQIRRGLSIERYATVLAEMIVEGLAPGGQPRSKESGT